MKKRQQTGFTLVEMMIVVAIIGILTLVAVPSYQDYVERNRLTVAQSMVNLAWQGMQAEYLKNGRYPDNLNNINPNPNNDSDYNRFYRVEYDKNVRKLIARPQNNNKFTSYVELVIPSGDVTFFCKGGSDKGVCNRMNKK